MNTIEEFFKNRISFIGLEPCPYSPRDSYYCSKNVFKPEYYNTDLLKSLIPFCYYLFSEFGEDHAFIINLIKEESEDQYDQPILSLTFDEILEANYNNSFFWLINQKIEKQERLFCYIAPSKPFKFKISIGRRIESGRESKEESEEESEKVINTELTFKSDECVICLTNPPNVLFCNCGHLCLCIECNED